AMTSALQKKTRYGFPRFRVSGAGVWAGADGLGVSCMLSFRSGWKRVRTSGSGGNLLWEPGAWSGEREAKTRFFRVLRLTGGFPSPRLSISRQDRRRKNRPQRRPPHSIPGIVAMKIPFLPDRRVPALLNAQADGAWKAWSSEAVAEQVRRMAAGLRALGLRPGGTVGILADPSPHWVMMDLAVL